MLDGRILVVAFAHTLVEAEESRLVVLNEFNGLEHVVGVGFFFGLFVDEPLQEADRAVIIGFDRRGDDVVDGIGDVFFVFEGRLHRFDKVAERNFRRIQRAEFDGFAVVVQVTVNLPSSTALTPPAIRISSL